MTETTNHHLSQWVKTDRVRMEDFNADNAKLDAAIAGKAAITAGTYTGDGADPRIIDLGARPKAVLVITQDGTIGNSGKPRGGLAVDGSAASGCYIVDNGFGVRRHGDGQPYIYSNVRDQVYNYIAFF